MMPSAPSRRLFFALLLLSGCASQPAPFHIGGGTLSLTMSGAVTGESTVDGLSLDALEAGHATGSASVVPHGDGADEFVVRAAFPMSDFDSELACLEDAETVYVELQTRHETLLSGAVHPTLSVDFESPGTVTSGIATQPGSLGAWRDTGDAAMTLPVYRCFDQTYDVGLSLSWDLDSEVVVAD